MSRLRCECLERLIAIVGCGYWMFRRRGLTASLLDGTVMALRSQWGGRLHIYLHWLKMDGSRGGAAFMAGQWIWFELTRTTHRCTC